MGFASRALMICKVGFSSARFNNSARSSSKVLSTGISAPIVFAIIFPPSENTRTAVAVRVKTFMAGRRGLSGQQRADVIQQFVGAHRAVAVVSDQAVDDLVDAAQLVGVGRLGRS